MSFVSGDAANTDAVEIETALRCAYCGKTDTPFEVDHILPRSRGGSNRISNLCLACHVCNQ